MPYSKKKSKNLQNRYTAHVIRLIVPLYTKESNNTKKEAK